LTIDKVTNQVDIHEPRSLFQQEEGDKVNRSQRCADALYSAKVGS
jgi:hypothetical protein